MTGDWGLGRGLLNFINQDVGQEYGKGQKFYSKRVTSDTLEYTVLILSLALIMHATDCFVP